MLFHVPDTYQVSNKYTTLGERCDLRYPAPTGIFCIHVGFFLSPPPLWHQCIRCSAICFLTARLHACVQNNNHGG